MAIKSKSNKENLQVNKENRTNKTKWVFTIITLILIGIISICLLLSYPIIKKNAPNYITSYSLLDNYNFREKIINTNYGIYYDYLEKKAEENDKELNPIEDLFTLKRENISNSEESPEYNLNEDKRELNSYIKELINKVHSLGNLRVYAMDEEGNTVYETKGDQNWLLEALAKGSYIENGDLENYYRFYMVLKYNNRGKVSLEKIYGEDSPRVSNLLLDMDSQYFAYHNEYEAKPIENMTYVYAVPKTLEYQDNLYYSEMDNKIMALGSASAPFIMIGMIVTCLLALLIPFKYTREVLGFNKFLKIPFEINFIIASIMLAFTIESGRLIIIPTLQGGLSEALKMTSLPHLDIVTNIINVLYWMVIYGFVFFEVIYVKYIFNIGFKNYIRKHLLVYKVKDVIFFILRKFINYIKGIDLNKNSDKVLLIILGINFVIVSILCSVWFFGIFGVVIYSGILFYFGRKYIEKWKKDYNKILEKTKEISNGNLDSKDDEDCGFFNPMRDELNNIQKGFKAAVEEEVKSQRMKTELISNVSHDLKTPLTSIINYVNILQLNNITEEERKEYIEILDKKSQTLKKLIDDLFEVSKMSSGKVELFKYNIDIIQLVYQCIAEVEDVYSEKEIEFKINGPEECMVKIDPQRMSRVFQNLTTNALKYSLEKTRVYVEIKDLENYVEISFKNISSYALDFDEKDILERFARGDESRNSTIEGSGLGLAIAKTIVELHNGKFRVECEGDLFKAFVIIPKNKDDNNEE